MIEKLQNDLVEIQKMTHTLTLEQLAYLINKAGDEYAEAKQISSRLEELKKPLLAKVRLKYAEENPKVPMAKLEMIGYDDIEYRMHIEEYVVAETNTLKARNTWEAYQNLFDAKRTYESTMRAKLEKGIYE